LRISSFEEKFPVFRQDVKGLTLNLAKNPNMDVIGQFEQEAHGQGGRVVLPEGCDARILRAARQMVDTGMAQPILLGTPDEISAAAEQANVSLADMEQRSSENDKNLAPFAAHIVKSREKMTPEMAVRLMRKPLYFGGMMVAQGQADTLVAGVSIPTRRVIEAGMMTVGLADGIKTPSSFFLMVLADFMGNGPRSLIYADCGFNVDPSVDELADIAISAAASAAELLPEEPKVAMLSFSTQGSATHPLVDKVTSALEIVRKRAPNLFVDGEFQADTALVPQVAETKLKDGSPVAGQANVLVFPNLDAGNIAYKITQYVAGARAIGPVLQGFRKPICDLSRGATVEDIVAATAVGLRRARLGSS